MKINKDHFLHNDALQRYLMRDMAVSFSKSYNYGLLPSKYVGEKPLLYREEDYIMLNYCDAITRDGTIIHIAPDVKLRYDLKDMDSSLPMDANLLILVSVNDSELIPEGIPNPNELPPRQPYAAPLYRLVVIAEEQMRSSDFAHKYIPVGRLIKQSDSYQIDTAYLPPCKEVASHEELLDRYLKLEEYLSEIGDNATKVVQNARSKKKRGEINDLAENTFYLMEKIVFNLADHMNAIRTIHKENSPIHMVSFLNSFGRVIYTALRCIKSVDREALLRYYESHLGFQPHQFESEIKSLTQIEYDHSNLNKIFDQADHYISSIRSFVSKAVNLEFHSVERVDVINETVVKRNKLDIF